MKKNEYITINRTANDLMTGNGYIVSYMNDHEECRRLPREEVNELVRKSQSGDEASAQQVCLSYLPYVYSLAKKYSNSKYPVEELVNVGVEGLYKALEKFDSSLGSFTTYVTPWIHKYLSKETGVSKDSKEYGYQFFEFDEDLITDSERIYHSDAERQSRMEMREDMKSALSRYSEAELRILSLHEGIDGKKGLSFSAIAERPGLSQSKVQRTVSRVKEKMSNDDELLYLWNGRQSRD